MLFGEVHLDCMDVPSTAISTFFMLAPLRSETSHFTLTIRPRATLNRVQYTPLAELPEADIGIPASPSLHPAQPPDGKPALAPWMMIRVHSRTTDTGVGCTRVLAPPGPGCRMPGTLMYAFAIDYCYRIEHVGVHPQNGLAELGRSDIAVTMRRLLRHLFKNMHASA